MTTKIAKDLRANDVIVAAGQRCTVRRVHGPTRRDWNHTTIYFRDSRATTVLATTEFKLIDKETLKLERAIARKARDNNNNPWAY